MKTQHALQLDEMKTLLLKNKEVTNIQNRELTDLKNTLNAKNDELSGELGALKVALSKTEEETRHL